MIETHPVLLASLLKGISFVHSKEPTSHPVHAIALLKGEIEESAEGIFLRRTTPDLYPEEALGVLNLQRVRLQLKWQKEDTEDDKHAIVEESDLATASQILGELSCDSGPPGWVCVGAVLLIKYVFDDSTYAWGYRRGGALSSTEALGLIAAEEEALRSSLLAEWED